MPGRPTKEAANNTGFDLHFKTFGEPALEEAAAEALMFCREMEMGLEPRWLTLLGPAGVGKTHLARWITCFFVCRVQRFPLAGKTGWIIGERPGVLWSWRNVSRRMKGGEFGLVERICEDWFAAIDDVGAEHDPTNFMASSLDQIANARLDKWTVLTSNFLLHQVAEQCDQRIASRMLRGRNRVVEINAKDFALRREKGSENR